MTSYYEALREQIVQPAMRPVCGLGWGLFVRRGMAVWLDAWREGVLRDVPVPSSWRGVSVPADQEQQDELIVVWTGMALSHALEGMG